MTDQPKQDAIVSQRDRLNEVNRIATILIDTWKRCDPNSGVAKNMASYVATFADMARAIVDDRAEIEAATIERCAGLAEDFESKEPTHYFDDPISAWKRARDAAAALRNLKGQTS